MHRTEEVKGVDFYAFSYYYDLAVNAGFIDVEKGGSLVVGDFEIAAKYGEWPGARMLSQVRDRG